MQSHIQGILAGTEPQMTYVFGVLFHILTHILIVISIFTIIYLVAHMILSPNDGIENTVRSAAFATGFLIYYGSKAIGLSIPSMILRSLAITNPFTIGLFGILIPSLTGYFVAWYCIKNINKNENIASRLIILIITFIIVLFGDVYVTTYSIPKSETNILDITLLPNLTFTIALSLYVILQYKRN